MAHPDNKESGRPDDYSAKVHVPKNFEDKFTKIILIPAAILLVHPVLPAPYFPAVLPRRSSRTVSHRSSRTVLPAPYFPTVLPAPFPSLCHKNRIRYILHCVLVYATRQNCSRDTRRDAPGDVFIAILLTVISSEPSCEPSCNPSCGTARASFQPLSINRIAADNSVGRGWAAEHAQFCFRSSPPIIPKKQFAIGVYT